MFWLRYGLPVCCVQSVRGLVQYRHRMLIALAKHGAARPNPTTTLPCSFTRLGLLTQMDGGAALAVRRARIIAPPYHSAIASGPTGGGPAASSASISASENTRERVMNRTPSAASSEKLSPPSATTSMVSWLFAQ